MGTIVDRFLDYVGDASTEDLREANLRTQTELHRRGYIVFEAQGGGGFVPENAKPGEGRGTVSEEAVVEAIMEAAEEAVKKDVDEALEAVVVLQVTVRARSMAGLVVCTGEAVKALEDVGYGHDADGEPDIEVVHFPGANHEGCGE